MDDMDCDFGMRSIAGLADSRRGLCGVPRQRGDSNASGGRRGEPYDMSLGELVRDANADFGGGEPYTSEGCCGDMAGSIAEIRSRLIRAVPTNSRICSESAVANESYVVSPWEVSIGAVVSAASVPGSSESLGIIIDWR